MTDKAEIEQYYKASISKQRGKELTSICHWCQVHHFVLGL